MAKKGAAKAKPGSKGSKTKAKAFQEESMGNTTGSFATQSMASLASTTEEAEVAPLETVPDEERPDEKQELAARKERPTYAGPRPDEELLAVVHSELDKGSSASVEEVYNLIRADEEVNQRNVLGLSPLAIAAIAGNGPLVSLLLEREADVEMRNVHNMELPLHYAARSGNRVVCQLLAEPCAARGLIEEPNAQGWPPLHLAVACGHMQAIIVLLKYGASVCTQNVHSGNFTPLHIAVRLGWVDIAEAMLDRDAQVDALDAYNRGALHFAAARVDYPCVSLLLRSKADAMRRDPGGKTAKDLVPLAHEKRDKVLTLLGAFSRPSPEPFRTDVRFDKGDARDLPMHCLATKHELDPPDKWDPFKDIGEL